ncbi:Uncharacterised protein [Salmonella enterica subsp. houtenae serovar Houten]|nr:Uncharacterised protein [Salmonella enterica subsp. houtenae serovar Houten]
MICLPCLKEMCSRSQTQVIYIMRDGYVEQAVKGKMMQ